MHWRTEGIAAVLFFFLSLFFLLPVPSLVLLKRYWIAFLKGIGDFVFCVRGRTEIENTSKFQLNTRYFECLRLAYF